MTIGKRIRTRRRAIDLTQEDLARRAEVSLSLINQIERGVINDPHYSTLTRVAEAMDMSVSELLEEQRQTVRKDLTILWHIEAAREVGAIYREGDSRGEEEEAIEAAAAQRLKEQLEKHLLAS